MIKIVNECFNILADIDDVALGEENINRFVSENKMTEQQRNLFRSFIQLEKARRNI